MSDAKAAADAVVQHARADLTERLRVACPYMSTEAKERILQDAFTNLSLAILEQEQAMIAAHDQIPFFKLPRELRDKIYRIVFQQQRRDRRWFPDEEADEIDLAPRNCNGKLLKPYKSQRTRVPKGDIALLLVCRQITTEAATILFGMKTFIVEVHWPGLHFADTEEIRMLRNWLTNNGTGIELSVIKKIVVRLRISSIMQLAEVLDPEVDQDAWDYPNESRWEPGSRLSRSTVVKDLGLEEFGIAGERLRVEYEPICAWMEISDEGHDLWQMEQERLSHMR